MPPQTALRELRQNASIADRNMRHRADQFCVDPQCGASYAAATRLKGERLIHANRHEPAWPGGRTHYDIDRDLIIFLPDFFRLARKTQVFTGTRNIAYRNRLRHTLDVVQLSRSIAHKHGLNTDLVEAIAYGHDIGHTPFGHAGEKALNCVLYEHFVRRAIGELDPPGISVLSYGRMVHSKQQRDAALWNVVQWIAGRAPDDPKLPQNAAVIDVLGDTLYTKLREANVIGDRDGYCHFQNPLDWRNMPTGRHSLQNEFWVQPTMPELFAHYIHSLRILVCNRLREHADVTRQTAYGIISHSWREAYNTFAFEAPGLTPESAQLTRERDETAEAYVVRTADNISFANSDLNDAVEAGILVWNRLSSQHRQTIERLANVSASVSALPSSSQRLQHCESGFIFSQLDDVVTSQYTLSNEIAEARALIEEVVHPLLVPRQIAAGRIIRELFWFFRGAEQSMRSVEGRARERYAEFVNERWGPVEDSPSTERQVTDYLAWLTDDEAIATHAALFAPEHAWWERYFVKVSDL